MFDSLTYLEPGGARLVQNKERSNCFLVPIVALAKAVASVLFQLIGNDRV
jgi:hypothetical protein